MASLLACCASDARGFMKCLCCSFPCRLSSATRLFYAFGFVVATATAFLLKNYIGGVASNHFTSECGEACYGYLAVNRISFGLVLYHGLLGILTLGSSSSQSIGGRIQNGFWPIKFLLLIGPIVGSFFMQDSLFYPYWIASLCFSCLFILLQNVILVDFAHTVAETWMVRYEETMNNTYRTLLIGATILLYSCTLIGITLLYVYFQTGPNCSLNVWFTTINLLLVVAMTVTSIHPTVREHAPATGLLQSGIVSLYIVYLIGSAINTNPNQCTAKSSTDERLGKISIIVGIALSFLALGYAAVSAGSSAQDLMSSGASERRGGDRNIEAGETGDDETTGTTYSYSFFHIVFVLAAFYMASVVNNWMNLTDATGGNGSLPVMAVDKGAAAMWVKAITSWVIALLYQWTLLAPIVFPDRNFS